MGKLANSNQVTHRRRRQAENCQDFSFGSMCLGMCMILNERKPRPDLHFKSQIYFSVRRRDGNRRMQDTAHMRKDLGLE